MRRVLETRKVRAFVTGLLCMICLVISAPVASAQSLEEAYRTELTRRRVNSVR